MHTLPLRPILRAVTIAFTGAALLAPSLAHAEEVVIVERRSPRHRERVYYYEDPRVRPMAVYPVEIEGHFAFGPDNVYGSSGLGGGLRLSVPLVAAGGPRVSDNLAITFGADVLHYDNCYFGNRCDASYLMVPAAAQFNLFLGRHFSLLAEGGAFFYRGYFDECRPGDVGCVAPRDVGVLPDLALGARVHLGPYVALVGRVGYPTATLGISFL